MNPLTNFILVSGINATGIVLYLLIKKKNRQLPHFILITLFVYILLVALHAYGALYQSNLLNILGFLFADTIGYFAGPALLIYIQSLFQDQKKIVKTSVFHFLPLFLYLIFISFPVFINLVLDVDTNYVKNIRSYTYLFSIQSFYLLAYLIAALYLRIKYKNKLKSLYSNLDNKDLRWILYLLIGMIATIVFYILINMTENYFETLNINSGLITTLILLATIIYLGYYGLSQSTILLPEYLVKNQNNDPSKAQSHHLTNASEQEIDELKAKLFRILEVQKPHCDPDLSLSELAASISTTPKKLTALLNQYLQLSFFDLINEKRVEEVKARLEKGSHKQFTLLAIAFDCGFNSKSSFNRAFRKYTKVTPKEYINQLKSSKT